jgi:hypothetical protein
MISVKKYTSTSELLQIFRGTFLARGSAGTNPAGSPNLEDLTVDAFAAVNPGDRIYLSGEDVATVFLVSVKTDDNHLILDNPVVAVHAADATWRACAPNAIDIGDMIGIFLDPRQEDAGIVLYDATVFAN